MSRRYLQFVNAKTGERAEGSGKIDVTNKGEREIETITRGMLRNIGSDWFVDDFEETVTVTVKRKP